MLILELLRNASGLHADDNIHAIVKALTSAADHEVQWALDAGLGPQLHQTTQDAPGQMPARLRELVLAADLTARVIGGTQADCASEIIAACQAIGVPATLLKGISICEQCYPEPHFRPMTDVDLLVPREALAAVESEALRMGFICGPPMMGPDPHHGEPLYHPIRRTKIELHTILFEGESRLSKGQLFKSTTVARHFVPARFRGVPVTRLALELQLIYIASYLTNDLSEQPIHPTFVTPVMDVVRLLRTSEGTLDWDLVLYLLDNELAAASLYLILRYLAERELARPPLEILDALRKRQNYVSEIERRLLESLIDDYLVAGRRFPYVNSWHVWANALQPGSHVAKLLRLPWRIAFPPTYPHRFDAALQARRLARWARPRLWPFDPGRRRPATGRFKATGKSVDDA